MLLMLQNIYLMRLKLSFTLLSIARRALVIFLIIINILFQKKSKVFYSFNLYVPARSIWLKRLLFRQNPFFQNDFYL